MLHLVIAGHLGKGRDNLEETSKIKEVTGDWGQRVQEGALWAIREMGFVMRGFSIVGM